jgi:RND family efflux transporter MFP subunit
VYKSICLFSVMVFVVLGTGCDKSEQAGQRSGDSSLSAPVRVKTVEVRRTRIPRTIEVVGTLHGDEELTISSKVAGRVIDVQADLGDRVTGGSVLARIDPVDYQLEVNRRENALAEALASLGLSTLPPDDFDVDTISIVERARLQADNASARVERAKRLFEQNPPLIAEQEYQDLQTAYQVAKQDWKVARLNARSQLAAARLRKSELDVAREQLANTRIVAPPLLEGRRFAIASRSITPGEYVREATPLFRLILDDRVKFRGGLPERFAQEIRTGQTIFLELAGHPAPVEGRVSRVSPVVDIATRTFQIEALFENPDQTLKPGAFAKGFIQIGFDEGLPVVPASSVYTFAGIDKVFSIREGRAVEHVVRLGPTLDDGWVVIREGLDGIQTIISDNPQRVFDGAPVVVTTD